MSYQRFKRNFKMPLRLKAKTTVPKVHIYKALKLFNFNNVYILNSTKRYDLIGVSSIWHSNTPAAVLARSCCSKGGISAECFFITDLI